MKQGSRPKRRSRNCIDRGVSLLLYINDLRLRRLRMTDGFPISSKAPKSMGTHHVE